MKLSNTTINFAKKRGLFLELVEADECLDMDRVWFFTNEDDYEPTISYVANDNGSYSFFESLYLDQSIKEELPATIKDEKHLRQVVDFISKELAKNN